MFNLTDQQRRDLELIVKAAEALKQLSPTQPDHQKSVRPEPKSLGDLIGRNPYADRYNGTAQDARSIGSQVAQWDAR